MNHKIIEKAVGLSKNFDKTTHHDQGNEIRHVGNRLNKSFKNLAFNFIDQESQNNGRRETKDQRRQTDDKGVLNDAKSIWIGKKAPEISQTNPGAVHDT